MKKYIIFGYFFVWIVKGDSVRYEQDGTTLIISYIDAKSEVSAIIPKNHKIIKIC